MGIAIQEIEEGYNPSDWIGIGICGHGRDPQSITLPSQRLGKRATAACSVRARYEVLPRHKTMARLGQAQMVSGRNRTGQTVREKSDAGVFAASSRGRVRHASIQVRARIVERGSDQQFAFN